MIVSTFKQNLFQSYFLLIILLGLSSPVNSQVTFQAGHVIDSSGQKINCFIKNVDWVYNPVKFEYKLTQEGAVLEGNSFNTRKFAVEGECVYVSAKVKIDQSSQTHETYSNQKEPEWLEQQLFLKTLIDGKASLYYFENDLGSRFFFSVDTSAIKQLLYKQYYSDASNQFLADNNYFRQQLWMEMRCPGADMKKMEFLKYTRHQLMAYFNNFNDCTGTSSTRIETRKKPIPFHLYLRPGFTYTKFILKDFWYGDNFQFEPKIHFRLGVEGEYMFPFNRNKWGMLAETSYSHFKSTNTNTNGTFSVDFPCLDFSLGVRYYMFLKKDVKLFVDASFYSMFVYKKGAEIRFNPNYSIEINMGPDATLGGGVAWKRFHLEGRYFYPTTITNTQLSRRSFYARTSLILGIRLWK